MFPTKSTICEQAVYHLIEKQKLIDQALKHKSYVNPLRLLKYAVDLQGELSAANSRLQEMEVVLDNTRKKLGERKAEAEEKAEENQELTTRLQKAETEIDQLKNKIHSLKSDYKAGANKQVT